MVIVMAKLTAKQQRFCDEYLIDLNATQAAIRAGYSKRSARQIADLNMSKHDIREYIENRMAEKEAALIANQDEVLKYLTSVLRGQSKSTEIVIEGLGDGSTKARKMEKEPSEKDKLKAAELLGKRYGLYTEKVEETVDMELNVNIDYGDEEIGGDAD
jgi:phage terminase small subunit